MKIKTAAFAATIGGWEGVCETSRDWTALSVSFDLERDAAARKDSAASSWSARSLPW